jgi:uncharacterized protein
MTAQFDLSSAVEFEWDAGNEAKNYLKHGITKEEAEIVFSSPVLTSDDLLHSDREKRFKIIGESATDLVLVIIFTLREGNIRIISARKASRKERKRYEEAKKNTTF